jgi:hypothetical protein
LAVELACLAYDYVSYPSVVRLVEEDLTEEQARAAARELLDACDFEPGFDLAPERAVLAERLAGVHDTPHRPAPENAV